jgi:hypothetical protein
MRTYVIIYFIAKSAIIRPKIVSLYKVAEAELEYQGVEYFVSEAVRAEAVSVARCFSSLPAPQNTV